MAFVHKKLESLHIGGQTQTSVLYAHKTRNLTKDEMMKSYNKMNTKFKSTHKEGEIMVRALTIYGWRTFKGFSQDDLNLLDEQEYLRVRGATNDGKFTDNFLQVMFILKH
jgi:leucyl aminopeptidase (aminopeptidase T)